MAILNLIIIVALIVFIISSFVGLVRFWRDTKKYSPYYDELKDLKEKAEKQVVDVSDVELKAEKQVNDETEVKDNESNN